MKKSLIVLLITLLGNSSITYAADCIANFSYSVSIANSNYASNTAWCNQYGTAQSHMCHYEATAAFNQAVDDAIAEFNRCCILSGLNCW